MTTGRLLFLGSKGAGLLVLNRLLDRLPVGAIAAVLCPDDRTDVRSEYDAFVELASRHAVPLHRVESTLEAVELIRRYAPTTVLVHGWYRMLPIARFPGIDFLGFHYSPLPRYRGHAPLVWQVINGEQRLGVSFFALTEGMDDGRLVDQAYFDLGMDEDIADAIRKANEAAAGMIDRFIPHWLKGTVVMREQSGDSPSYCGLRTPEDGRIDWRANAKKVHDFIRAQARPYPGAYSLLDDGRVARFWRAQIETRLIYGVPGSVVELANDAIVVACGDGALRVREVAIDGESAETSPDALQSLRVRFR